MSASATMVVECPRNPGVETALRCQQCDSPICPKCLVQSPVGAKCKTCARVYKSPIYVVKGRQLVYSAAAAIGGGLVIGFIWATVLFWLSFGFLSILVGAGLGYAFSKMLRYTSREKRGPVMIGLAILGIAIAWSVGLVINGFDLARYGLLAAAIGAFFAYRDLR